MAQFHVLAVDDSIIDRKLIEALLKTSSYQVTMVDSGSKALEFLGLHDDDDDDDDDDDEDVFPISLIITDYSMPGMTGYDLLRKIKNSKNLKDVPVVIMSSENVADRCLEEGAEEFFMKPVQLSDVKKLKPHMLKGRAKGVEPKIYKRKTSSMKENQSPNKARKLYDNNVLEVM